MILTIEQRATGCRHITCKCGAEFCYVCGSRWRSCSCTEVDEANRQALLRRQRQDRDAVDQAEADEVARAIAVVEALVRQEAEARRQREEEEERERQREEAELARLEQIRLEEEAVREHERRMAELQLRDILRLSIQEDGETLTEALKELLHAQHIALDDRQGADEQRLLAGFDNSAGILIKNAELLQENMQKNVNRRIDQLELKQEQETIELAQKQEEQEDDLFLQIQTHLKGKPNREAREKRLLEGMRKEQEEAIEQIRRKHEDELKTLEGVAAMEVEGLKRSSDLRRKKAKRDFDRDMQQLLKIAAIDRRWFEVVWERRIEMVQEHGRMMVCEFEGGREPLGLTEEQAKTIMPLPVTTNITKQDQRYHDDSIQHTPVELEAPMPLPNAMEERQLPQTTTAADDVLTTEQHSNLGAPKVRDSRATSSSSYHTAPSQPPVQRDYQELLGNPWAWAMTPARTPEIWAAKRLPVHERMPIPDDVKRYFEEQGLRSSLPGRSANSSMPTSTKTDRRLTPPSPVADDTRPHVQATEQMQVPMPHNGNAYLSLKNGECSHPIYDLSELQSEALRPTAPPTPPESPLMPGSFPPTPVSTGPTLPYHFNLTQAARSGTHLQLRVPSRLSSGGNSIDTTVTITPTDQTPSSNSQLNGSLRQATKAKPKKSIVPLSMGNMYMDSFLDVSSVKNKASADIPVARRESPGSFDISMPSIAAKEKKSRWPFRRKTYTDDEIKDRMKRAVGDALAA